MMAFYPMWRWCMLDYRRLGVINKDSLPALARMFSMIYIRCAMV